MKSVSIVGFGWLGLPLAVYLRQLGWEVKGTKRTHEGVEEMRLLRLETYHLELTPDINADPDDLSALFAVGALIVNVPPSQYFFDYQQYVQGIRNLVTEALLHNVSHIIFIGSTSVFPETDGQFDEYSCPQPNSEMGKALLELEQWLWQLTDIDCDIIRFGGLIGEDRHPIHSLTGKTDIPFGNQPINVVHLDDCARAIQLLLETPSGKRLYHLVSPQHPSRAEYYTAVAEKLELNPPHFVCMETDPQRIIHADKISKELDFVYQHPDPFTMLK